VRERPAFTPRIRIIKWPIKENKKFHETRTEGHPSKTLREQEQRDFGVLRSLTKKCFSFFNSSFLLYFYFSFFNGKSENMLSIEVSLHFSS